MRHRPSLAADLADDAPERQRPPKPPLSGAIVHVRRGGQFVLSRQTSDGRTFLTGSNGWTSWAVRPDGSVRESTDLNEFNRDVPGHEHSMPLIHIEEGLERLLEAYDYDVRLLPVETADDAVAEDNPTRPIFAVKKRHYRGPKRVEISYSVRSGLIQQLRFVEMPYGPEHLTLIKERPLGDRLFDHESHHKTDQPVIKKMTLPTGVSKSRGARFKRDSIQEHEHVENVLHEFCLASVCSVFSCSTSLP